jgi:hypothetical protein
LFEGSPFDVKLLQIMKGGQSLSGLGRNPTLRTAMLAMKRPFSTLPWRAEPLRI